MRTLLRASEAIDWINAQFGKVANLLVLVDVLSSARAMPCRAMHSASVRTGSSKFNGTCSP